MWVGRGVACVEEECFECEQLFQTVRISNGFDNFPAISYLPGIAFVFSRTFPPLGAPSPPTPPIALLPAPALLFSLKLGNPCSRGPCSKPVKSADAAAP